MQATRKRSRHRGSARFLASLELENRRLRYELKEERAARKAAECKVELLEDRLQRMELRLQALEEENRALRNSRRETDEYLQKEIRRLAEDVAERDETLEEANEQKALLLDYFNECAKTPG
jgi:uncharacterized protein YydD (DUF2326 family)